MLPVSLLVRSGCPASTFAAQAEAAADYTIRIEASNDMAAVVLIYVARCSLPIRCDQAKISETLTRPPIL